jgi:hypothetical protein
MLLKILQGLFVKTDFNKKAIQSATAPVEQQID